MAIINQIQMHDAVNVKSSLALAITSLLIVGCKVNAADKPFTKTHYDEAEIVEEVTGFAYVGKRKVVWAYDEEERGTIFTTYDSCKPGENSSQILCDEMQEYFEGGNKGVVLIISGEDNQLTFNGDGYKAVIRNAADLF